MKTINKKLNSQSGVTILFAMLLFLVATVVSLVIIVAATSSVNRESSFKESVQRNIELDSAVLMVKTLPIINMNIPLLVKKEIIIINLSEQKMNLKKLS